MKVKRQRYILINPILIFIPSVLFMVVVILAFFGVVFNTNSFIMAESVDYDSLLLFQPELDSPRRIIIPKISVDLPVARAVVEHGTWQTFENSASYGVGSSFLNEGNGNTVIFAHARDMLFSRLDDLKEGEVVYVLSGDDWYKYEVVQKIYVDPVDTGFLSQDFGRSLILFTCFGPQDQQRVVVIAKFTDGNLPIDEIK